MEHFDGKCKRKWVGKSEQSSTKKLETPRSHSFQLYRNLGSDYKINCCHNYCHLRNGMPITCVSHELTQYVSYMKFIWKKYGQHILYKHVAQSCETMCSCDPQIDGVLSGILIIYPHIYIYIYIYVYPIAFGLPATVPCSAFVHEWEKQNIRH